MKENLALAEKKLNHKLSTPEHEEVIAGHSQNLGLDEDVNEAVHNLALVEKSHKLGKPVQDLDGSWEIPGY